MLSELLRRYAQFIIFSFIGVANTLVHGAILMLCVEVFGFFIVLSHLIAFCIANIVSFILNSLYTFQQQLTMRRYFKFLTASMVSLGLTLLLSWIMNALDTHYLVGFLVIVILVPLFSFAIMKYWTFASRTV